MKGYVIPPSILNCIIVLPTTSGNSNVIELLSSPHSSCVVVIVTDGTSSTLTVTSSVAEQPFASVAVTLYVVVTEGLTVCTFPWPKPLFQLYVNGDWPLFALADNTISNPSHISTSGPAFATTWHCTHPPIADAIIAPTPKESPSWSGEHTCILTAVPFPGTFGSVIIKSEASAPAFWSVSSKSSLTIVFPLAVNISTLIATVLPSSDFSWIGTSTTTFLGSMLSPICRVLVTQSPWPLGVLPSSNSLFITFNEEEDPATFVRST